VWVATFFTDFFQQHVEKYGFATGRLVWELLRFFFYVFCSTNIEKKNGSATGRTAMFFWFEHFWCHYGKKIPNKNNHYGIFQQWPELFVFLAFQVCIYIYTYIYISHIQSYLAYITHEHVDAYKIKKYSDISVPSRVIRLRITWGHPKKINQAIRTQIMYSMIFNDILCIYI
jgi:hypothetical protein